MVLLAIESHVFNSALRPTSSVSFRCLSLIHWFYLVLPESTGWRSWVNQFRLRAIECTTCATNRLRNWYSHVPTHWLSGRVRSRDIGHWSPYLNHLVTRLAIWWDGSFLNKIMLYSGHLFGSPLSPNYNVIHTKYYCLFGPIFKSHISRYYFICISILLCIID